MSFIQQVIEKVYYYNTNKDWDTLHLIAGDEGKGKSNLMLHLTDMYLRYLKGETKPEDIKWIAQDAETFQKIIKNMKKCYPLVDDEAGDITNRRAMSALNVRLSNKYKVIRGENAYTQLVTPTPFELESYFLKQRCKGFWYVYRRGRVAFWTRESFIKILALNQGRYLKTPWVVRPDFYEKFPMYKGPLKEPYDKQKQEGMKKKREESDQDESKTKAQIEKEKLMEVVVHASGQGYTNTELSNIMGVSTKTIQRYLKEGKDNQTRGNNIINNAEEGRGDE